MRSRGTDDAVGGGANSARVVSCSAARFFIESVTLAHIDCVMAQNTGWRRLAQRDVVHKGECDGATLGNRCSDGFGGHGCGDAGTGGVTDALFC